MFEEIKGFSKINNEFLKLYKPSYRAILDLYVLEFLSAEVVKNYLASLLDSSKQQEAIIVTALISNDENELRESLEKLTYAGEGSKKVINSSIWLILKWLEQTSKLPKGFDLVVLCNDLVVHFEFPELEEKLLYVSLADWKTLEKNIQTYLYKYRPE